MGAFIFAALMSLVPVAEQTSSLNPLPIANAMVEGGFWTTRLETNRRVTLYHGLAMLERNGYVRNFELAAAGSREGFQGLVFFDSDAYKLLEAIGLSLAQNKDADLERRADALISKIAAAQRPDGYLNTWFQIKEPQNRFKNLRDNHELYCAGHLIEAAVAYKQGTGKTKLMDVAIKFADLIDKTFGPYDGTMPGYCGHPEIEIALLKLYQETNEVRYLNLARAFILRHGQHYFAKEHGTPADRYDGTYFYDRVPIYEQDRIEGHAVRAGYLLSSAAMLSGYQRDAKLETMLHRVWRNATERRAYVTGGIGSSAHNEGFTTDFDLPNMTAYQETCASIAMAMWAQRMANLTRDGRFADAMETALYNGVLSGVSLDGKAFFYVNPLASRGGHHRQEWFGCACCPPNVARVLAGLSTYAYAQSANEEVFVHLYANGSLRPLNGVELKITTDYPLSGRVSISVGGTRARNFTLALRVPGWCKGFAATLNGARAAGTTRNGYLYLERTWKSGDALVINMPMPVRAIATDPRVKENLGRLAYARGPIVYCAESLDGNQEVLDTWIPGEATIIEARRNTLGGHVELTAAAFLGGSSPWSGKLYEVLTPRKKTAVKLIPYSLWDNRGPASMQVWFPTAPPPPEIWGPERTAKVAMSFVSSNCQPEGVNDGSPVKKSSDQPAQNCHWWPHKGSAEWVEYSWSKPVTLTSSQVFFFDDTGRGECRLPASWKLEYWHKGRWTAVRGVNQYPIALDKWNEVRFEQITTMKLRLSVQMQPGWAAGVLEWKVEGAE